MPCFRTLAIVSDIHYAGLAERARVGYPLAHISHPLQRLAIAAYRRYFWQRDPFAHNHLLDQFIDRCKESEIQVDDPVPTLTRLAERCGQIPGRSLQVLSKAYTVAETVLPAVSYHGCRSP